MAAKANAENGRIHVTTGEEWRALVDRAARYYLNMSVDEFVRAWEQASSKMSIVPKCSA